MKKNLQLILLAFSCLFLEAKAQTPNPHYSLRDKAIAANQRILLSTITADGGMIVLVNYKDFSLIRYDATGKKIWNSYINGETSTNVNYQRLMELPDKGFAIVGTSKGGDGIGGFIVKTDAMGKVVFAKSYGYEILDCSLDPSDNGFLISTNAGNTFSGIIKTDQAGVTLWSDLRDFGPSTDHYFQIKRLANGNYLAVGIAYNNPSGLYGVGIVACYSATGTLLWSQSYKGSEYILSFRNITELENGSILLSGFSTTFMVEGQRMNVTKIDSKGKLIWSKSTTKELKISFEGFTSADNFIYGVGGYEIFPNSRIVNPVIVKMDTLARLNWAHIYPKSDWSNNVAFGASSNGLSVKGNRVGFNNYLTFCMADTALKQTCFLRDTAFSLIPISMQTDAIESTKLPAPRTPIDMVRTSSFDINFEKFDACIYAPSAIENQTENASSSILVYPNPVKENLIVDFANLDFAQGTSLTIINSFGHIVKRISLTTAQTTTSLDGIIPGVYFYKIYNQDIVLKTGKFMIE